MPWRLPRNTSNVALQRLRILYLVMQVNPCRQYAYLGKSRIFLQIASSMQRKGQSTLNRLIFCGPFTPMRLLQEAELRIRQNQFFRTPNYNLTTYPARTLVRKVPLVEGPCHKPQSWMPMWHGLILVLSLKCVLWDHMDIIHVAMDAFGRTTPIGRYATKYCSINTTLNSVLRVGA